MKKICKACGNLIDAENNKTHGIEVSDDDGNNFLICPASGRKVELVERGNNNLEATIEVDDVKYKNGEVIHDVKEKEGKVFGAATIRDNKILKILTDDGKIEAVKKDDVIELNEVENE